MSYDLDPFIEGGGIRYNGIAGEALAQYQVVYVAGDGRWYRADADVPTSVPVVGLTMDPAVVSQKCRILIKGVVQNINWTWTEGQYLYLSQTIGAMTQTAPTGAARAQIVGAAITSTIILFDGSAACATDSLIDYEVQTGIIAEPTYASRGNGHAVVVYNSTEDRTFLWLRCNADSDWMGVEVM